MDLSYVCRGKQGHKVPLFLNPGAGVLAGPMSGDGSQVTVQSCRGRENRGLAMADRRRSGKWRRCYVVLFLQAFQNFLSELVGSACAYRDSKTKQARADVVVVRVSGVMSVRGPMLEYAANYMRWILCRLFLPTWRTISPRLSRRTL